MIRKLRIALANWIMPRPQPVSPERIAELWRELAAHWFPADENILRAVKTFPGGLTVIDKSMIKQVGPDDRR